MKKIIVTIGMSNSGKSTWTHNQWLSFPDDIVVINRDKIRELLFGYDEKSVVNYYNRSDLSKLEKRVTKYEDSLIYETLEGGKIPIVDATHLNIKYLERFKYWNVEVHLQFFDISLKEAEIRNESRVRKVPREILIKQYNQYISLRQKLEMETIDYSPVKFDNDITKEPCVIVDIDGTIAHHNGLRSPYDWKEVGIDSVDKNISFLVEKLHKSGVKIIICTGRDGVCLGETKAWLYKHKIPYDDIFIRPKNDMRPDWVVKQDMWRIIAENHYITAMIDDRLQVVRRARALGL